MRYLPVLLTVLAAAGCGVEDDPRPASFTYIHEAILKPACATAACHSTFNYRERKDFEDRDIALSYWDTGSSSKEESAMYLLIGGTVDPETIDLGPRMPLDAPLPEADILLIGRWIDEGSENN